MMLLMLFVACGGVGWRVSLSARTLKFAER